MVKGITMPDVLRALVTYDGVCTSDGEDRNASFQRFYFVMADSAGIILQKRICQDKWELMQIGGYVYKVNKNFKYNSRKIYERLEFPHPLERKGKEGDP